MDLALNPPTKAFRGTYPIGSDEAAALLIPGFLRQFASGEELIGVLEPFVIDLEKRLEQYEGESS